MATLNFNLRKTKKGESSIIAVIRIHRAYIRYATRLFIARSDWDTKKQRPKQGKAPILRNQLDQYGKEIREYLFALQQEEFSEKRVREQLALIFGHSERPTASLLSFAEQYSEGKRKELRFTINSLKRFLKGRDLLFIDVDVRFVEDYREWLKEQCLQASSINCHLGNINQFLKVSYRKKLHDNGFRIEKQDKVKRKGDKAVPVSLTGDELQALASLTLEGNEEIARDLFLIGIFTGQRWSDYSRICPEMISNGRIHFTQKKTGTRVSIRVDLCDAWSLSVTLSDILKKHGNTSPEMSYNTFRRYLSAVAKKCVFGTTEDVSFPAGKRTVKRVPKCDLITSHVARKTFCTLLHKSGLSDSTICAYSGHKTESMLREYIGISEKERLEIADRDAMENMKPLNELGKVINIRSARNLLRENSL